MRPNKKCTALVSNVLCFRSGAQEWEDTENSGNPEEGVGDEPKGNNDFYKSYYEEEEKLKEEEEKAEFLAEVAGMVIFTQFHSLNL